MYKFFNDIFFRASNSNINKSNFLIIKAIIKNVYANHSIDTIIVLINVIVFIIAPVSNSFKCYDCDISLIK